MKQFKKILCGVMLTSFVIIGSICVFAFSEGYEPSTMGGCLQAVTDSATTESVMTYTETQRHHDTMSGAIGDDISWDDTTPIPTPTPGDTDGDGEVDVIYKTITNYNTDWVTDEYNCEDGTTSDSGVEVVCTAASIDDPAPGQLVLDGAPRNKDDVIDRYGNCAEIDITVTYKYKYYYTVDTECDCEGVCTTDHTETRISDEVTTTRNYSTTVGKKIYGNDAYVSDRTLVVGSGNAATPFSSQEAAENAITTYAKEITFPSAYQEAREASLHEFTAARSAYQLLNEDATVDLEAYYVYTDDGSHDGYAICTYYARQEIIGLIVKDLITQGYFNVSTAANNYYFRNGCRTYSLGFLTWNGYNGDGPQGERGSSPAHDKLTQYYQAGDFFVKDNNNYAILFPLKEIRFKNTNGDMALGKPIYKHIWHNEWNPMLVKLEEKVVYAEMVTNSSGKPHFNDVVIGRDNGSVDVYIQNITNPESVYANSKLFPLSIAPGKFGAIRASYDGKTDDLVYPYPDGSGFGWKLNFGQSGEFTATKESIQGTNRITGFAYADIYKQRLFRISEEKNLFAYAVGGNGVFVDGEYMGLRCEPEITSESCNYKWRALFNVYTEADWPGSFETNNSGMSADKMITNVGIYSTEPNSSAGTIIPVGAVMFSYNGKPIKTTVKALLVDKSSYEEAFSDIILEKANFKQLRDENGNIRNALFVDSDNAGIIKFENGTHPFDYKNIPSHVKPTKTNGATSLTEYGLEKNGIFVYAQAFLKEVSSETIVLPYSTTTTKTNIERNNVKYYICIGQHNCDCEDINVLCDCQNEIAGCSKDDTCEDNPNQPQCQNGPDCTENPDAPECGCFDNVDGNCNCPPDVDPETCKLWIPVTDFNPDCLENPDISCDKDPPGGITGGGSEDYFDKFYKPSSTITN